mmetsp:Transcript_18824/g.36860  ORF Transcript_18824/g.36860 Transcript_18824/m.36860 type:complete len:92 (-) Transcript_18824:1145-1420(-)
MGTWTLYVFRRFLAPLVVDSTFRVSEVLRSCLENLSALTQLYLHQASCGTIQHGNSSSRFWVAVQLKKSPCCPAVVHFSLQRGSVDPLDPA